MIEIHFFHLIIYTRLRSKLCKTWDISYVVGNNKNLDFTGSKKTGNFAISILATICNVHPYKLIRPHGWIKILIKI